MERDEATEQDIVFLRRSCFQNPSWPFARFTPARSRGRCVQEPFTGQELAE